MQRSNGRLFVGIAIILVGLVFFVKNLDFFSWEIEYYFLSWPTYIFVAGLIITVAARGSFVGFSLMLVGAIFIAARFYDYPAGEIFSDLWPLFLIFFGLSILFRHRKEKKEKQEKVKGWSEYSDDTLDISTIFSEDKRRIVSQNFRSAKLTTIFGSTELDFSEAKPAQNCVVNCDTIFGGTELIIPSSWKLINKSSSLFGGTSDERRKSAPVEGEKEFKITVEGFAMFGGIEIKS